jgi:hypothetical protein
MRHLYLRMVDNAFNLTLDALFSLKVNDKVEVESYEIKEDPVPEITVEIGCEPGIGSLKPSKTEPYY